MNERLTHQNEQLGADIQLVYDSIDLEHPENNRRLADPLTEQERAAHEAVLDEFFAHDLEERPESMRLARDWSDTLAEHEAKQAARDNIVFDTVVARIEDSDKLAARRNQIKAHNDNIKTREAAQKPKGYMQLYMDTFKDSPDPEYTDSVVDTDLLKAERGQGPTPGQQSQQKTIDALKEFRKGFVSQPEPENTPVIKGIDPRKIHVNAHYNNFNLKIDAPQLLDKHSSDNKPDIAEAGEAPDDTPEDEQDTILFDSNAIGQRVRGVFKKAQIALQKAHAAAGAKATSVAIRSSEFFTDEENGKARKKIAAKVAGAIVASAALYGAYKGISGFTDHNAVALDAGGLEKPPLTQHNPDTYMQHNAIAVDHVMRINEGNPTISHAAEAFLQQNGYVVDDKNIYELTNAIMNNLGIDYNDARHLQTGYKLSIPQEALEHLKKA